MFDAKAWLAANQPPQYHDKQGRTHIGRLWSHLEYLRWITVFESWSAGIAAQSKRIKWPWSGDALDDYARELRSLIASQGFAPAVVDEILTLPDAALEALLKDFFDCQSAGRIKAPSTTES